MSEATPLAYLELEELLRPKPQDSVPAAPTQNAGVLTSLLIVLGLLLAQVDTTPLRMQTVAVVSLLTSLLLATVLTLVRKGRVPILSSLRWVLVMEDGLLFFGALLAVGTALSTSVGLSLLLGLPAGLLLFSAARGVFLRRYVRASRPELGKRRILALMNDPRIQRWRTIHAPVHLLATWVATFVWGFFFYYRR